MKSPSRLEQGRRRLRTTRRVIGTGSVIAFAAFALVARSVHPGRAGAAASTTASATTVQADDDRVLLEKLGLKTRSATLESVQKASCGC